ncbi:EARP-interacting protein-like isoform X3 [Myotis lucifugus]|uniref:EARP-interacting protein-like isoform X3 n=1 Tax=Myotis lucifugus TaxID=59463 RepID=UPI000CCBF40B|nr:EARP-interacting protein-like isoform X3 [Myotis lucifugus]
MEDDAPVIYGLEFQIHIIDFDDENNIINKNVLLHQVGEIWHISASPADKGVLATCYNKRSRTLVSICHLRRHHTLTLLPVGSGM